MKKMNVESEFATLRSVVLAQSEFCFPNQFDEKDTAFLTKENAQLMEHNKGKDLAECLPEYQKRWEKEKDTMQALMESYDVTVYRPRRLTDYEKKTSKNLGVGYSNFFSRDPFFTAGNLIVEGSLRFKYRRQEILPLRSLISQWANETDSYYFATPQPDISEGSSSEIGPFIEGGDVLVLGKTLFVGYSGLASNLAGIQWLTNLVRHFDYEVVPVKLHPKILHLDCALSFVREGLMIVCEEALLDGIPPQLENWEKIRVTLQEATLLVTNGLPINEHTYITDSSFTTLIEQLEAKGIKVEAIDYSISRMLGGSFRCTTQALMRE